MFTDMFRDDTTTSNKYVRIVFMICAII